MSIHSITFSVVQIIDNNKLIDCFLMRKGPDYFDIKPMTEEYYHPTELHGPKSLRYDWWRVSPKDVIQTNLKIVVYMSPGTFEILKDLPR